MTVIAADVAAIAAVAGVVVAIVAMVVSAVVGLQRFRPTFEVAVDERRQAIRLDVVNKGRASGSINSVAVIAPGGMELPAEFPDFRDGKFTSYQLTNDKAVQWTIKAVKDSGSFPADARVLIGWGKGKQRTVTPKHKSDVSYYT